MADPESNDAPSLGHPTGSQRRILWTALTALAVLALVGVAGLVFFGFVAFLSWCYPILLPIGLAVIIALVLEPAVSYVQKKRGMKRDNAALLICLMTAAAFFLFWAFLSKPLIDKTAQFFDQLPDYFSKGVDKFGELTNTAPDKVPLDLHSEDALSATPPDVVPTNQIGHLSVAPAPLTGNLPPNQVVPDSGIAKGTPSVLQTWLKTNLPAIEQTVQKNVANVVYAAVGPVGQAFGFLLGFGFVPIYVYYFLAEEEEITRHWHEYVPLRRSALRDEVISVLAEISASLVSYFRGQIIVAACNGVLTFIGLALIGVQYSLVLGLITGALSIVPFLGIICSILPALLLAFLAAPLGGSQWLRPGLVLVVFTVVQMSESMFITPRVQSHSTGLHPLTIIIGILFWSMLLPGLLGPIVAVPLTCAVVVLLRRYVWLDKSEAAEVQKVEASAPEKALRT